INPYLAFETLIALKDELPEKIDEKEIIKRYIKSIDKGILKVMSKMGISTYQSYCGAQIFDAVGLRGDFVERFFFGTASRIEGVGLDEIAEETARRHREAFGDSPVLRHALEGGGEYLFRLRGEAHALAPRTRRSAPHRGARYLVRQIPGFGGGRERAGGEAADHSRPVPHQDRRGRGARAGAARRGRARQGHREAVFHRRHVVRLD